MKISPIYFNSNNTKFCGKQCYSTEKWIELRDMVTRPHKYGIEGVVTLSDYIPSFNKAHFEYSDYKSLSPKERLIIDILNKKRADLKNDWDYRNDLSIKKDAQRIFTLASNIKEFFDDKYKNGYKLVGIGNSPAPIVETMQLLGADAVTLPFSKVLIEESLCREFPYERWAPDGSREDMYRNIGHWGKCSAKDWEEYFKYYGVEKDFCKKTGKALLFTDYVAEGWTQRYLESILKGIGFDKNYEFIRTECLLPSDIRFIRGWNLGYNLGNCLDNSKFKCYAKMESPKHHYREVDIIKHPEYIPSLPEGNESKLFRCALYDLIAKNRDFTIL
ncbi:MAG: hypothetical protein MJ230_00545 [bacterium]|nr:hypothetical protein [bacterium]